MTTADITDDIAEIHSIANLSPVSPSPVYNSTASAVPALQSQADFLDNAANPAKAVTMAHVLSENKPPSTEEDTSMDDDIYQDDSAPEEQMPDATSSLEKQPPATEEDDEYAKQFDSPLPEEAGGAEEQESEAQKGGSAVSSDLEVVEQLNVSSVQSNTGASGPAQPSQALDASTTATTAPADITTTHASSVPPISPADLPSLHPSLPAKPDAEHSPVDVEPSKGALASPPNNLPQQMPDSASSPRADGSNNTSARPSHLPAPLTGQPTHGLVNQHNHESSGLPQPPSNPLSNGSRQTLPPASADLPSRPPVDMNRMRGDLTKPPSRHGGPNVKPPSSKGGPQAPGVASSQFSVSSSVGPARAAAPGVTASLSALGPPPGPSNPSLPAPPTMPSNMPLHYPARPVVAGDRPSSRGEYQSKWEAYLADEKRCTAEQKWERFPDGSRVFIGNLSSDKVSKRDVFDLFHHYGRLAQISLKSAFGFVQYHTYEEAQAAVESLQGVEVKGRKIHLEFSRTQKKKESTKEERVRSPDRGVRGRDTGHGRDVGHGKGGRSEAGHQSRRSREENRHARHSSDFNVHHRDEPYGRSKGHQHSRHSRDRSTSPRRGRDRYSKDSYRHRSRSAHGRGWAADEGGSSDTHSYTREPAPDVQLLLLQEVDPGYVKWVRDVFTERGLRSDVMIVNPTHHIKKDVISRLVAAGTSGIVELDVRGQERGEVYLHLYDLSGGLSNVRFHEYRDLKPYQAADLVRGGSLHSYQPPAAHLHAAHAPVAPAPAPAYGAHPAPVAYHQHLNHGQPVLQSAASTYSSAGPGTHPAAQPDHEYGHGNANANPASDAAIQAILSQLQQTSAAAHAPQTATAHAPQGVAAPSAVDIQAILNSLSGNAGAGTPTPMQAPPQHLNAYTPTPASVPPSGAAGQATDAQVQNIMAQLARFRQ